MDEGRPDKARCPCYQKRVPVKWENVLEILHESVYVFLNNAIHDLKTKDLLILVYFDHCPENKEIGRRGNLDVLHGPDDGVDLVPVMAHHGARIDEIVFSFGTSFFVSF